MRDVIELSAEVMTTKKRRQYYLNPEPHFFMGLTITKSTASKDGESEDGRGQDKVYSSLLKQSYKAFRFFHGTFTGILESSGPGSLHINVI